MVFQKGWQTGVEEEMFTKGNSNAVPSLPELLHEKFLDYSVEAIFILGGTLVSTEQVCSSDGVGW